MIQVVTTKDFRKSFEKYADDVANYNETIIVARPKKKNIVVISKKEYNSWQETNYLLQSKTNSNALAHSINQLSDSTKNT
ncbi:type II toxin-antitoxin system Phd/YefM family antitoxin [Limosilactobacillus reuteri]|nr:type II toxin-antitoxin system Phd/YefM family antitoxin [Lactobacillus intestinalis]